MLIHPSNTIPTVKIATDITESGFMVINASDFDASTMTLFGTTDIAAAELETASELEEAAATPDYAPSRKKK